MILIDPERDAEREAFAHDAARAFAENPQFSTFTRGDIEPGTWFAVRWGMNEDCVVVFKIDEDTPPANYMNLVREYQQ